MAGAVDGTTPTMVMGGVMKLGKALATGVAEERPEAEAEEARGVDGAVAPVVYEAAPAPEAVSVPEEVPAVR
ncbi:hypothetical protein [Streptomyces sp. CRN 30]|uniref:hypothetical protein n=1 Tax=Streptomyces sp. CRN 30 TaxID=3075613 RepID=UPI002A8015E8|nr:hypothetical protein [Streptomyces sp. CRN 30]